MNNLLKMHHRLVSTGILAFLICLMSSSSPQSSSWAQVRDQNNEMHPGQLGASSVVSNGVVVGPGDVLSIQVFPGSELNQRVRVESDGTAVFLLIGRLHVSGLDASQISELIDSRLIAGGFLLHPSASVFVEQYFQGIKVFGEIAKPSIYPPVGNGRLSDLLAAAGGLSQVAGRDITITSSKGNVQHINWKPSQMGDPNVDVQLSPGDMVYVPKSAIFYVGGNVAKPGSYILNPDEKLSVLQAIFLAGGTLPATTREKSIIVRTIDSKRTVVRVNVTRILQGKDPDPILTQNDILYIPPSTFKSQFRLIETAAISFVANPFIYFH